jgi:integrase
MSRVVGRLNARKVATAKLPKGKAKHVLPDGGNLYLEITSGAEGPCRSWLFAYQLHHRRRWMGLGATHTVSLAEARAKARALRQQLIEGVDPLEAKRERVRAAIAEAAKATTFEKCADSYIELHGDAWSARHLRDWQSSLRKHVFGKIGKIAPADIDSATVMKVVQPMWKPRTVTASRVLDRIAMALDYAAASGFRSGDNPARAIRSALPKQSEIAPAEHHPALLFERVPEFMAALRAHDSITARALEMLVLTASRTNEVRAATRSEIDFSGRKWNRPAENMKGSEPHTVPLCDRAIEILRAIPPGEPEERIFPVGNRAMDRLTKRLKPADVEAVPHGFRSSFRQWCAARTNYPDHICEMALAHKVSDAVVKAYKRKAEPFEKRVRLMQQWAEFCNKPAPAVAAEGSNVVAIGAGA